MCVFAVVGINQPHKFTIKTRICHEDVEPFLLSKKNHNNLINMEILDLINMEICGFLSRER